MSMDHAVLEARFVLDTTSTTAAALNIGSLVATGMHTVVERDQNPTASKFSADVNVGSSGATLQNMMHNRMQPCYGLSMPW